jgi:hypothetical protein
MTTNVAKRTRILACGVFKPAIEYLRLGTRYPYLRFTYLPPVLHITPQKLEQHLQRRITTAQRNDEKILCLYGECIPDISNFCQCQGVLKVPGHSCYEMLLGTERFEKFMDETAGTYFLEKELILNFREYCMEPLELDDEEMRECYFKHYQKLLYIRQPTDPDLLSQAYDLADLLELSLAISEADYSHLEEALIKLI